MAIAPILILGWFSQKQLVRGLPFGAVVFIGMQGAPIDKHTRQELLARIERIGLGGIR